MRRMRSNDSCWCGSGNKFKRCHGERELLQRPFVELGRVSPMRTVPDGIVRPDYVAGGAVRTQRELQRHDDASLERLREACRVAAEVLLRTGAHVAPGVTTDELDGVAHDTYVALGAYPSTLGYRGFSKSICTSVNGVICHGIPDDRALQEGDIVNVDVTAYIAGMHGDTSATFAVGSVDGPTAALIESTREATLRGIAAVRPGVPISRIAAAIEPFALSRGLGVIREYGGHGIGETFHADPHVNHCVERHDDFVLEPWISFTVEPMLTAGQPTFHQAPDGWTEHADDALVSAQFEHTVVVTEDGVEILTVTAEGDSAVGSLSRPPARLPNS